MPRSGVTTFPTAYRLSVVDLARAVEERGLDSIFFNEHTHIPVSRRTAFPGGGGLPKEYSHTHDPFVALAAAATNPAELQALSRHCAANYMSETWTCASASRESYLGSGYSKQLDCNLEDDLAAGMSRYFTG